MILFNTPNNIVSELYKEKITYIKEFKINFFPLSFFFAFTSNEFLCSIICQWFLKISLFIIKYD